MYLEYQLTIQEYKDFCYYTGWSSPAKKTDRIKYYYVNTTIYLLILAILFSVSGRSLHTSAIESVAIVLIVTILLIGFMIFRIKTRFENYAEKKLKDSGQERILSLLKLNITESGIIGSTEDTEMSLKWTAIFKKTEANNCYYLYLDSTQAIIVPKRAFNSVMEKEEFDKILLQHIPSTADLPEKK